MNSIGNHALTESLQYRYEAGFIAPDLHRDMAAFDALPVEIQRVVDIAPFVIAPTAALDRYRKEGLQFVLDEIEGDCEAYLIACELETGVPRPKKPLIVNPRRRKCLR